VRLAERPALGALIETREAECAVEDGATVEEATRDMRARRFGGRAEEALRPPVMLSKAIAAAEARAVSRDMVNKVRTTGECLRAYFGDVPLERLADRNERVAFLLVSRRFSGAGPGRGGATVSAGRRACMAGGSVSTLGDGLGEIPGVRSQRRSTAGSSGVGAAVSAIETMASGAVAAASLRTAVVIVGRGP